MNDDPLEAEPHILKKFKRLSTHFRQGWEKLHPISETQRSQILKSIEQEWEQNNRPGQVKGKGQQKSRSQQQERDQQQRNSQQEQSQSKSKGRSQ